MGRSVRRTGFTFRDYAKFNGNVGTHDGWGRPKTVRASELGHRFYIFFEDSSSALEKHLELCHR
jgi:hypothetical protein